jgi:hypothetical protein
VLVSMDLTFGQMFGGLLAAAGGIVWRIRHLHRMKPPAATTWVAASE